MGIKQRMTNQFLQMVLPYRKPMALIINVVMQVIPRHDTCHMMAKQFLNNMWRRTIQKVASPLFVERSWRTTASFLSWKLFGLKITQR